MQPSNLSTVYRNPRLEPEQRLSIVGLQLNMEYPSHVYYNMMPESEHYIKISTLSKQKQISKNWNTAFVDVPSIKRCTIQLLYIMNVNHGLNQGIDDINLIQEDGKIKAFVRVGYKYKNRVALGIVIDQLEMIVREQINRAEFSEWNRFFEEFLLITKEGSLEQIIKKVQKTPLLVQESLYRRFKRKNIHGKFRKYFGVRQQKQPSAAVHPTLKTNQQLSEFLEYKIKLVPFRRIESKQTPLQLNLYEKFLDNWIPEQEEREEQSKATLSILYESLQKQQIVYRMMIIHHKFPILSDVCSVILNAVNSKLFHTQVQTVMSALKQKLESRISINNEFQTKDFLLAFDRLITSDLVYEFRAKALSSGIIKEGELCSELLHYYNMLEVMNAQMHPDVGDINWKQVLITPPFSGEHPA